MHWPVQMAAEARDIDKLTIDVIEHVWPSTGQSFTDSMTRLGWRFTYRGCNGGCPFDSIASMAVWKWGN
jgi:hypothetical protein